MNHRSKPLCAAIFSAMLAGGGTWARAEEPATNPDVSGEIKALRARIDQLEAQQREQEQKRQQDAQQQQEASALNSVLNDADRKSRMFDSTGVTGGWNEDKKQFFIGSDDGNFYLHPIIIFQFRGDANWREHVSTSNKSQTQLGFEIRRAKFGFDGNIFSHDLTYKFQWQDNSTGSPSLEYGWGQYVFAHNVLGAGDIGIRGGQSKDVVFKEEFNGDQVQLMVERSLANTLIGGNAPPSNLIQGVDLLWLGKENPLHAETELHDGFGSGNTPFTQPHGTAVVFPQTPVDPPTNPGNWGVSGRVDYKVFGDWADTTDFTGLNSGKHDLLDVGAGIDYTDAQGSEAVRYTADVQYQWAKKLSVFAAFYGDNFTFRHVKGTAPTFQNNYGGMIEGGYMLTPAFQVVGRYSYIKISDTFKIAGQSTFQEVAVGGNFYGPNGDWGNHAKLSVDLTYLPDGAPGGTGGLDYLPNGHNHNEVVLRTQFTLWL